MTGGLLHVLEHPLPKLLICVPYFIVSTKQTRKGGERFWKNWALANREKVVKVIRKRAGKEYLFEGSYIISKPLTGYKSKKNADRMFPH